MFRKEGEHVSLIALLRELRQIGEVEIAKVLRKGNLFIKCINKEQRNKALHFENEKVVCE